MTDLTIPTAREFAAIYFRSRNMEPEIPFGSVVFLAEPGFRGEGIYGFAFDGDGGGRSDIRRVCGFGRHWTAETDNAPLRRELSRDQLLDLAPRPVVGITKSYTAEFSDFLWARFMEVAS